MTEQPDGIEMSTQIHLATDDVGDPMLIINVATPPGTFMSADTAEQLALHILAAAARSRVRSGLIRDQMLTGATTVQAVEFADSVLGD